MSHDSPHRAKVAAALAIVYVVWGSTYYAIAVALETLPPFLMAGLRFLAAGLALLAWARWRGHAAPSLEHWRGAAVVGVLLFVGGNGGVVWAEQHVASGVAAVLIATVPAWIVVLDWLRPRGPRPGPLLAFALVLGTTGVAVLVNPLASAGESRIHPAGALVLVLSAGSWATGSLLSRHLALPPSTFVSTSLQMISGGVALLLVSVPAGELPRVHELAHGSTRSWLAVLYLAIFGSLVAFTAYAWLLRATAPAVAATYAYVNPVVAVLIGTLLGGEPLGPRMVVASAIIVAAVALITTARNRQLRSRASGG